MRMIALNNGSTLSNFGRPYIVAEMNTSHNGKLELAKQMIAAAKECGCDCVKFQSWTERSLYSKTFYDANPLARRMVNHYSFSEEQLMELCEYCEEVGISFSSTPYAKGEVDFLADKCRAPYIKVASMDVNNYPFLTYIAKKGLPIVLSTGMADMEEIRRAVRTINEAGNHQICLLHCVAEYPPEMETIHLNNIHMLRREFPECPIGLSDHTPGWEIASAAVALGASLIEKHFTLDKRKPGWDNAMAMEPEEMRRLTESCHNVYTAMGTEERVIAPGELEQRKVMRRSIVAARDLRAGEILAEDDLDCKRPGTGMPPEFMEKLVGVKILRDVSADEMLCESDIQLK